MDPPQVLPYAQNRYRNEVARLYGVLDRQLANHDFVAGDTLSISDIAIWPWAQNWKAQQQDIADKPHFTRWLEALAARPAFIKGKAVGADLRTDLKNDKKAQEVLFGKR